MLAARIAAWLEAPIFITDMNSKPTSFSRFRIVTGRLVKLEAYVFPIELVCAAWWQLRKTLASGRLTLRFTL